MAGLDGPSGDRNNHLFWETGRHHRRAGLAVDDSRAKIDGTIAGFSFVPWSWLWNRAPISNLRGSGVRGLFAGSARNHRRHELPLDRARIEQTSPPRGSDDHFSQRHEGDVCLSCSQAAGSKG